MRQLKLDSLSHLVTVYRDQDNQFLQRPFDARILAEKQFLNLFRLTGNDGKTTSKSGLALSGTSYCGKLRTAKNGGSWL